MASSAVESQRLISLSLGKIAQSRSQKGGINLHKNLLVATVLHKARTACMMEYQTLQRQRQLQFQQQQQLLQQQQKDAAAAAAREFEQKQEQARSAALSLAAFNTSPASEQQQSSMIPTCVREMEEAIETGVSCSEVNTIADAGAAAPVSCETNLGHTLPASTLSPSGASDEVGAAPLPSANALVPSSVTELELGQHVDFCNKENAPPHESDIAYDKEDSASQVVPQAACAAASLHDHLAAATQLAEDAAGLSTWCADGKQRLCQTSAGPTCNVLKRQREDNSGASAPTYDQECPPATKKARLVAFRRDSCSTRHAINPSNNNTPDMVVPDSSQISNLVSIFNSGFTGLCASQDSECSSEDYSSSLSCDSSTGQYTTLTPVQPDSPTLASYSRKMAESSPLSCSSSLGRSDILPSPVGLVLTV